MRRPCGCASGCKYYMVFTPTHMHTHVFVVNISFNLIFLYAVHYYTSDFSDLFMLKPAPMIIKRESIL